MYIVRIQLLQRYGHICNTGTTAFCSHITFKTPLLIFRDPPRCLLLCVRRERGGGVGGGARWRLAQR